MVIMVPIKTAVKSGILLFLMYKLLNYSGINIVIFNIYNLYVINFTFIFSFKSFACIDIVSSVTILSSLIFTFIIIPLKADILYHKVLKKAKEIVKTIS